MAEKANYSRIAETYDISRRISKKNIELWLNPVSDICNKQGIDLLSILSPVS